MSVVKVDGDGCVVCGVLVVVCEENGGVVVLGEGEGVGGVMCVVCEWVGGDGVKVCVRGVGSGGAARRAARGLNIATTIAVGMYVYWIFMGMVVWILYLGECVLWLRFVLLVEGYLGNVLLSAGAFGFVARNVSLSFIFVVLYLVFLLS